MFFSDMELKTLAITPPLLLFFRGASFGSSKAFHCLLLLSCLLLSSVNTLHNLPEYTSFGSYAVAAKGFNGGDSKGLASQNVCPVSHFFSFLSALRSENQFDSVVSLFGLFCPNKSWSNSALVSDDLSSVVWLSPRPLHIIEFQPFHGLSHIGETDCYKFLSRELYVNKNSGELSIVKVCGGNGFMVDHQCEGFSLDSIKLLYFYKTELSWSSGVAVFAVPMKETEPVLMLNLWKKPIFWVRTKKLSVAVLITAALLILIFCFNDHFIDENHKRNLCSHIDVEKVEKPSTITISPEMDSLLRSISKETLRVCSEVVESVSSTSCQAEEAVSLTVKTEKDKKRRRNKKKKKKNGAINTDVSSSQSGNSTPRSPMTPKLSTTQATTKPPKPILSHSATFPVSKVKSMIIQGSTLAPNVRAPGTKSRTEVKEEYRYDIWGDHLTGLNLMDRFKEVREGKSSGFGEDECESFFVKGPQSLIADSHARFVSFCNQWG